MPFGDLQFASVETEKVVTALAAAIIGLGLNEGAYLAEITRSGLESVDVGQTEAAKALGMKPSLIMRRAIIPQAMRVIIPPPGNETIGMLKTTSLVLALPFTLDLQYATSAIANCTYAPIPPPRRRCLLVPRYDECPHDRATFPRAVLRSRIQREVFVEAAAPPGRHPGGWNYV